MQVVNLNYYAKLPLPHVIFNRFNYNYESLAARLGLKKKIMSSYHFIENSYQCVTVTHCTTSTLAVSECKFQGAMSDGEKNESCRGY